MMKLKIKNKLTNNFTKQQLLTVIYCFGLVTYPSIIFMGHNNERIMSTTDNKTGVSLSVK